MGANVSITTTTNGVTGQRLTIEYIQDASGNRTYWCEISRAIAVR
ncbi:MAG: hypothetical protein ABIQ04_02495 [Candidatus Saccharimonadales bacterium]